MAEVETKKDFRNELLKRREVEVIFDNPGNPGIEKSKEIIVEQFKTKKDNVVVKKVISEFGKKDFVVDAFIYDSKEDLKRVEPVNKKEEAKLAEEEKKRREEEKTKAEEAKKNAETEKAKALEVSAEEKVVEGEMKTEEAKK